MLKCAVLLIYVLGFVCGVQLKDFDDDSLIHPILAPSAPVTKQEELNNEFWVKMAQKTLASKLTTQASVKKAKNIILFLGDGMSLHTVTATRFFISGENETLSFEKFPYFGLSKTYCVDEQVADSACTATAYLSGVKANVGTIGVNAKVLRQDCKRGNDKTTHTRGLAMWAHSDCKSAGLVTTARVTHASPSGVYAHTANRDWEGNEDVRSDKCDPRETIDIAQQLVHWDDGKQLKVVLGGGRGNFRDSKMKDEAGLPGWRSDGKDLIDEWKKERQTRGKISYVWDRKGLLSVDPKNTDFLLGLFSDGHCPYHGDIKRKKLEESQPTLTTMTEMAIKVLQNNDEGFFLFVEGARIDMAHHATQARKALEDTEEFAKAIQKALDLTSREDTLIVVTSDHSHTMTINGYPDRGNDVLGLSGKPGDDNLPYTTLSYANGIGYYNAYKKDSGGRRNLSNDNFQDADYEYMATVPLKSETHGGDDVGVYAIGPDAHLFVGNYEQTNIPILMSYAAKIGPYAEDLNKVCGFAMSIHTTTVFLTVLSILFIKLTNLLRHY